MAFRKHKVDPRSVKPSKHVLFFRGLPGHMSAEKVRSFIADEVDCPVYTQFFGMSDDKRNMYVALRFESHKVAKEILNKYSDEYLFNARVTITWFKDLKAASSKAMQSQRNDNGGGGKRNNSRDYNDRNARSFSREDDDQDYEGRYNRNFKKARYSDEESGQSRSASSYSNRQPSAYRDSRSGSRSGGGGRPSGHSGGGGGNHQRGPTSSPPPRRMSPNSSYSRRQANNSSKQARSTSSRSDDRSMSDDGAPLSGGDERGGNFSRNFSNTVRKRDQKKITVNINQNNDAIRDEAAAAPTGTTPASMAESNQEKIRKRKNELELAYKKDCDTFATVTRLLINKDSLLEDRLLSALKEVLWEMGQECIQGLRVFINKTIDSIQEDGGANGSN